MIGRRPVVLAYHGVGVVGEGDDPDQLVLDPLLLERQLRLLVRLGYQFATASELIGRIGPSGPERRTAVLSFDDGWRDAVTEVLPLLERLELRASFYVCPGWLGGHHPLVAGPGGSLLDENDLLRLVAAGMEVGSHSMSHRDLRLLPDAELDHDLSSSRQLIESMIGEPCRTFAYPYGLFDDRVEAAVQRAGYQLALAWGPGPWRPLAVPRLPAPPRHGARRLALKLAGVRRPAWLAR